MKKVALNLNIRNEWNFVAICGDGEVRLFVEKPAFNAARQQWQINSITEKYKVVANIKNVVIDTENSLQEI